LQLIAPELPRCLTAGAAIFRISQGGYTAPIRLIEGARKYAFICAAVGILCHAYGTLGALNNEQQMSTILCALQMGHDLVQFDFWLTDLQVGHGLLR